MAALRLRPGPGFNMPLQKGDGHIGGSAETRTVKGLVHGTGFEVEAPLGEAECSSKKAVGCEDPMAAGAYCTVLGHFVQIFLGYFLENFRYRAVFCSILWGILGSLRAGLGFLRQKRHKKSAGYKCILRSIVYLCVPHLILSRHFDEFLGILRRMGTLFVIIRLKTNQKSAVLTHGYLCGRFKWNFPVFYCEQTA